MASKRQDILDWLNIRRRPEIRIQYKKSQTKLPLGTSKIGGCPDVPCDFVWPRVKGGLDSGFDMSNMSAPKMEDILPGADATSYEEYRAMRWAKLEERQKQDPNYQLPQGEKLQIFEQVTKQGWDGVQASKLLFGNMFNSLSDQDWQDAFKIDPKDVERAKAMRPLSFMAQIDLAEVSSFDKENLLPKAGRLLFFYDYEACADDKDAGRVFYFPPETTLVQMPIPDDMEEMCVIPELQLSFSANSNVPGHDRACEYFDDLYDVLSEDDFDKLWQEARDGYTVKLLGYSDAIQGEMEEECEIKSKGFDFDDYNNNKDVKAEVDKNKDDWILLFQLDSIYWGDDSDDDDEFDSESLQEQVLSKMFSDDDNDENDDNDYEVEELMFGDGGCLYFWIRKQDLAVGRFDQVYVIMQCH